MGWTNSHTPSGAPVFNAKRTGNELPVKKRVVVDPRQLNSMAIPDVYPLPTQADIVAAVAGSSSLSVMDATAMFYQWPIHPDSYQHTGVVSHRGHEYVKVCEMGFLNSVAHVQRNVDNKFRHMRSSLSSMLRHCPPLSRYCNNWSPRTTK